MKQLPNDFWFPGQHVKDLRSHSILTSKKAEKLTAHFRSLREVRSQGKQLLPKLGPGRQTHRITA